MEKKLVVCEKSTKDAQIDKTAEEYAYLDRGGFSSEKFKIEVRGLPKFYGIAELKKLMNGKLGLNTSKIKRPKHGSHWLYACFQNDEERTKAIETLNGYNWKGKTLIAEVAKPAPDPLVRKRKQEEENPSLNKKQKQDDGKSQEEKLMDATTPYWNLPYEEQLKLKEKDIRNILMKFDNEIWKINKDKRKDIEAGRKLHKGLSFELMPIQKSPVTEGYRNKCEFTVGIDDETKLPTVGFRLGSYTTGTVGVAPIQAMKHISENSKKAVLLLQEFVRKSNMAPFSPADYSGYWRYLTVRNSKFNGDVMLIVAMHPQNLTEEELNKIKSDLIEHFSSEEAIACGIKSLYIELLIKKRVGEEGSKPTHLMGSTHIIDTILGKQFRISPEAFFQINTAGADILYQKAIDMSEVKQDSTVVDICCGTGTIGLCFAKHCGRVLGLELIPEAVKDAKANAEINKIENCDFFTGKAEEILPSVLARATGDDVIAIVDPPRAGLHMRAVTLLRNIKTVKRLVYISCSPSSAVKNFIDLARQSTKLLRGAPFVPIRAVAVDMFPLTKHVELAILFERAKSASSEGSPNDAKEPTDTKESIKIESNDTKESNDIKESIKIESNDIKKSIKIEPNDTKESNDIKVSIKMESNDTKESNDIKESIKIEPNDTKESNDIKVSIKMESNDTKESNDIKESIKIEPNDTKESNDIKVSIKIEPNDVKESNDVKLNDAKELETSTGEETSKSRDNDDAMDTT